MVPQYMNTCIMMQLVSARFNVTRWGYVKKVHVAHSTVCILLPSVDNLASENVVIHLGYMITTQKHKRNLLCYAHCIILFKGFVLWIWFLSLAHAVSYLCCLLFYTGCEFLILPYYVFVWLCFLLSCLYDFVLMPYHVYVSYIFVCRFVTKHYVMLRYVTSGFVPPRDTLPTTMWCRKLSS